MMFKIGDVIRNKDDHAMGKCVINDVQSDRVVIDMKDPYLSKVMKSKDIELSLEKIEYWKY